jgi:hypothetical protein
MYGDHSDYYRNIEEEKEKHKYEEVINNMVNLGYKESILKGFETIELELMYSRIIDLKRQKLADLLIEKLNNTL